MSLPVPPEHTSASEASRSEDGNFLESQLPSFGAPQSGIVRLDGPPTPRHLPYLDLLSKGQPNEPSRPLAVVELQRRPVLYAIRGPVASEALVHLRRVLALRGEAESLAVVEPGRLQIYGVAFSKQQGRPEIVSLDHAGAAAVIPRLALEPRAKPTKGSPSAIHRLLLGLMNGSTRALIDQGGLDPDDALSLTGRALFIRFLLDRNIIGERDLPRICPGPTRIADCMSLPTYVARTCKWLDVTFNGNLLPLSRQGFSLWANLSDRRRRYACGELSKILHRTDHFGQLQLDWGDIDFGHVPIGLLSQVYEQHAHEYDPNARSQSVHYTPRSIAEYMVEEAFYGLSAAAEARVLDPSVGAGVFLVAAFRNIVAERWKRDGVRPNRAVIRQVLYHQLTGFDINVPALRLTALSLYLTALELDPHPHPLRSLRFRDLRGRVLHDVRLPHEHAPQWEGLPIAGSLGPAVDGDHRFAYDVVIGNPPWTAWTRPPEPKKAAARAAWDIRVAQFDGTVEAVLAAVKPIVASRLGEDEAKRFTMVDYNPDLPFCWRALEWCRPGGRIAFALHGRLLFKRSPQGDMARSTLLRAAKVTGILNGAALSETNVWPTVKVAFCLFFAKNLAPGPGDSFTFVSPELDEDMNRHGYLRIDASSAVPVLAESVVEQPELLKTLFKGTGMDVSVMERLRHAETVRLADYWAQPLARGQGYQLGETAGKQMPSEHLLGKPNLTTETIRRYRIDVDSLPLFDRETVLFRRREDIYRGPLVIVPQSPGRSERAVRAMYADKTMVYNESFMGFSCCGAPEADLLARYLLLLLSSDLVRYVSLLTSSKFGVERRVFLVEDLEDFPIRPLSSLSPQLKAEIIPLSNALLFDEQLPQDRFDAWLTRVYGLGRWDLEVIRDTLAIALPFAEAQQRAQRRPSDEQVRAFCARVEAEMSPFLRRFHRRLALRPSRIDPNTPWISLAVSCWRMDEPEPDPQRESVADFVEYAESFGTTQIFLQGTSPGTLLIGSLAQYRYWTPTRARLLATTLLQEYGEHLLGRAAA
jgi:hypothetical protein